MHFEFLSLLSYAVENADFSSVLSSEALRLSMLEKFTVIQVETAPQIVGEMFGSNIAFKYSHLLAQLSPQDDYDQIPPEFFAEKIVEAINVAQTRKNFSVSLGDQGYVNATPSVDFIEDFFEALYKGGSELLFQFGGIASKILPKVRRVYLEDIQKVSLNPSAIVQAIKNKTEAELSVELNQLCVRILDYNNQTSIFDDCLMGLAVLGDSEIDLRGYLGGIYSSENVPWYLQKCIVDSALVLQAIEKKLNSKEQGESFSGEYLVVNEYISNLQQRLINFRYVLARAIGSARVELVIAYLVEIAGIFFSYYHRPQFRDFLIRGNVDKKLGVKIYTVTKLVADLIILLRAKLEISCVGLNSTLDSSCP